MACWWITAWCRSIASRPGKGLTSRRRVGVQPAWDGTSFTAFACCVRRRDSLRRRCWCWRSASARIRAIFSLVYSVLLRPLPYREAGVAGRNPGHERDTGAARSPCRRPTTWISALAITVPFDGGGRGLGTEPDGLGRCRGTARPARVGIAVRSTGRACGRGTPVPAGGRAAGCGRR